METKFLAEKFAYTGEELRSLFAYLKHGVLGDSMISWIGPCQVSFEHMVDGEDLRAQASIQGSEMVHFVAEFFHRDIYFAVSFQRLLASIVRDVLFEMSKPKVFLVRDGDDLFLDDRKLSISIAAPSPQSVMIHFAVNVSQSGTPVKTCALNDFGIEPQSFAKDVLSKVKQEFHEVSQATKKVRPLNSY